MKEMEDTQGSAQDWPGAHRQNSWPQTVQCLAGRTGLCGATGWALMWCTPACVPLPHSWGSGTRACMINDQTVNTAKHVAEQAHAEHVRGIL